MTTTLEILRTGPLALVEDLGRTGLAHLGVDPLRRCRPPRTHAWPIAWWPTPTTAPPSR